MALGPIVIDRSIAAAARSDHRRASRLDVFVLAPATVETLTRGRSLGRARARSSGSSVTTAGPSRSDRPSLAPSSASSRLCGHGRGMLAGDRLPSLGTRQAPGRLPRGHLRAAHPRHAEAAAPHPHAARARRMVAHGRHDPAARRARAQRAPASSGGPPRCSPASRERLGTRFAARLAEHVAPPPPAGTHPETYIAAVLATRRDREYAIALRQASRADEPGRHSCGACRTEFQDVEN